MQTGYRLRPAEKRDLAALPEIERLAGTLFADQGLPASVLDDATPPEAFAESCARGLLWVAVDGRDRPVGFAQLVELADGAHLEEIDVDPAHGRRGIGTALVEQMCRVANRRGHAHVTLTTFRDLPWNAPFYGRLGFRPLDGAELTPALRRVVEAEVGRGHDPARRVAMRRVLAETGGWWRRVAVFWLVAIVGLSAFASVRPHQLLRWTPLVPGRDKTWHFLLMGGFAAVCVLAFAGRRLGTRYLSSLHVLAGAVAVVVAEEWVQRWLPRRSFSLEDLASSLAGVVCFGGLAVWWRARRGGQSPPQR